MTPDESDKATNDLLLLRAQAINAYAGVEKQLCITFNALTKMEFTVGSMVFYSIVNTRQRNALMLELIALNAKPDYAKFYKSLFKMIGRLDGTRNRIVHWHVTGVSGRPESLSLVHPREMGAYVGGPQVSADTMREFIEICDFTAMAVSIFSLYVWGGMSEDRRWRAWRDIFLRPLTYPPPKTHPIFQKIQALRNQPRSSDP